MQEGSRDSALNCVQVSKDEVLKTCREFNNPEQHGEHNPSYFVVVV